jgi:hypothetical protein
MHGNLVLGKQISIQYEPIKFTFDYIGENDFFLIKLRDRVRVGRFKKLDIKVVRGSN